MDKLLCDRLNENGNNRHRRPFAYKTACNHLETMESAEETAMGIAKAGNRKKSCKTDLIHGRPLSMDSNQNMCCQSNLKRKAVTGRTCQLLRLLYGTTCFEVMLNRRMPNGMYGGVRGERKSPLLDFTKATRKRAGCQRPWQIQKV